MASTPMRYAGSESFACELAHALPWRRAVRGATDHVLLLGAGLAFLVSAAALLVPQATTAIQHFQSPAAPSAALAAVLTPSEIQTVLAYAEEMRPDDVLVQVKAGVFAKRSNVAGVSIDGRTVYYDVLPDQSFGPLRTGKMRESEVNILAQQTIGGSLVVVYQPN